MAHNLLFLQEVNYRDQFSTTHQTQGKGAVGSCLEPGYTMMWLLGARRIAPDIVTTCTIEPNASKPTNLPLFTYPSNEGIDKNNTYATVPHIMNHHMVLDTLPHPARSSITALRTFFGIAILVGSCISPITSLVLAAELFPFAPPSSSQQRSVEQQPAPTPQLSTEDKERISRIVTQTRKLSSTDRNQLKGSIQRSLNEAAAKRNLSQVKYFSELLRQID